MPIVRLSAETQQNPIRFKNVMKLAEAKLQEYQPELRHTDAVVFLQPAYELDQEEFGQRQDEGIALFIAVEELVVVNDRFHLKPLMPLLAGDDQFYILALSQR